MPAHRRTLTAALALTLPDAARAAYTVSYSANSGVVMPSGALRVRGARLRLSSVERGSHGPTTTLRSLRSLRVRRGRSACRSHKASEAGATLARSWQ